jgi:WD40 repeat protein
MKNLFRSPSAILGLFLLLLLPATMGQGRCQPPVTTNGLTNLFTAMRADFNGVAWAPDDSYALIVGDNIVRCDGKDFNQIQSPYRGNAVAFQPGTSLALIVGSEGAIVIYDGQKFSKIESGSSAELTAVAWEPAGAYALIVGSGGTILKFDGSSLTDLSVGGNLFLEGVAFKASGSLALISGMNDYTSFELYTYDGEAVTLAYTGEAVWPGKLAWNHTDNLALIPADWGHVYSYNGEALTDLETGVWQQTDGLSAIAFQPDQEVALVVGSWAHSPMKPWHTVLHYDNGVFTSLLNEADADSALNDVAWRHDGSMALIVGQKGTVMRYEP